MTTPFPEMGVGLGALREARHTFAALERDGKQPFLARPAARDTIVSMRPAATPVAQQPAGACLTQDAETRLLRELQAIDRQGNPGCQWAILGGFCAIFAALAGCLVDLCESCDNRPAHSKNMISYPKAIFSRCYPTKEDLKRQHIEQARDRYDISRLQEDDLIRRSLETAA